MPNLEDFASQALQDGIGNKVLGNPLVVKGSVSGIKITNAVDYQLQGQVFTKAATDNIAMTAQPTQANGTTCYYLITIDAAGIVYTIKGTDNSAYTPDVPSTQTLLAILKVVATAAFTSGTTALGTQGTFAQAALLPRGRQANLMTYV